MGTSNHLVGLINFLTLVLSIPILVGGIWLSTRANEAECLKFLQWPLIIIGLGIMVISSAGLVGACYRNTFLMRLYLVGMLLTIAVLLGFIIFAFAATDKGSGRVIQNRAYLEYYLQDYPGWLEKRVIKDTYWEKISSCIRDSKVCRKLGRTFDGVPETADMFYFRTLTPIQSGCCKPPTECGYTYENETVWGPGEGVEGSNPDCRRWSNDQKLLCYDCDSCKAGVLASVKKSWRKVSLFDIVFIIFLFIVYIIAYAAYRNNRESDNHQPFGRATMTKELPR